MTARRRFWRIAGAGAAFQAGSSAVDSATVMSALVFQLTGSAVVVGAVTTILRLGWLLPQLFVGFLASKGGASMPFYAVGALGRTAAIALLALVLGAGAAFGMSHTVLGAATMSLWTLYAFLSGLVGVPYNDIVARSIRPDLRSRMLALRFFGGGLAGLGVAAIAHRLIGWIAFPASYAAVFGLAALLMLVSSLVFLSVGEPEGSPRRERSDSFATYLKDGIRTFRSDGTFRRFVFAQWCGGAVLMAAPFFVVAADRIGVGLENVALLLAAQTAGALLSNPLWGWWGDRRGKLSLMRGIALMRAGPPLAFLGLYLLPDPPEGFLLPLLAVIFFLLGALVNGTTIAVIGLLMEFSPNDRRPAYSGYFNALIAPAYLLPVFGGIAVGIFGLGTVFVLAVVGAVGQTAVLAGISQIDPRNTP